MLNKDKKLQDIFDNDPLGLLEVKPIAAVRNEDNILVSKFQEIIDFYQQNQRLPLENNGVNEHTLYSRLCDFRETESKRKILEQYDEFGLLEEVEKKVFTIDDIMQDDPLGLLDEDDMGLFDFNLVQRPDERASADFVARRKFCSDFENYKDLFKEVQKELSDKKRKLIQFKEDNLLERQFYVHNGILLYLEHVDYEKEVQRFNSGARERKDGRTRIIFENGTESNMLYRSLYKALLANGNAITENADKAQDKFEKNFNNINEEDKESGFIYILKSKSDKPEIKDIKHLYKIGFSTTTVEERIKNAAQEPTYLMAEVRIIMTYKCFNMNTHKLESLLHNFFGSSCLNVDVFDALGNRHTPREWFIAPLDIIEQVVQLIISGEIMKYRYDGEKEEILIR
jgi:hypothetical protein